MKFFFALIFLAVVATDAAERRSFGRFRRRTFLTTENGARIGSNQFSLVATSHGGLLLQDVPALEKLRRFNTERIAERVVHAQGVGAFGTFTATADLSDVTAAHFLRKVGRRTPVAVRFSTVTGEKGSAEAVRDPRGFSVKFRTAQGNFDLVSNNIPVFFIRDHIKFPDLVHAVTADPVTNLPDPNRFFDFMSALGGDATHMLTFLFSDKGTPKSYRFMDGNSVHAYKFVDASGRFNYVKFRWATRQGVRNFTAAEASATQGMDTRHATRDLVEAIRTRQFPKWDLFIQVVSPAQLKKFKFNGLDATKIWPESLVKSRKVGELVLNRLPSNFFLETERMAFDPGNFLAGALEPSEDRLLQGRLISYHESQVHRFRSSLFNRLPVNRARVKLNTYSQGGVQVMSHDWRGSINYEPNNDPNAFRESPSALFSRLPICGTYEQREIEPTLNFKQAGETFRSFSKQDQMNLVSNIGPALGAVRNRRVRNTMCAHFYQADRNYGLMVTRAARCHLRQVLRIARHLRG